MARQAVDIVSFFEIEILVFPAVTGMTGGTTGPVTLDTDTEVIDRVFLAGRDQLIPALNLHRLGFPAPVRRVNDLVC